MGRAERDDRRGDTVTHARIEGRAQIALSLFITDTTPSSARALAQMERLSGGDGPDVELTVINVLEHPDLAEAERVMATPALIRHSPPPRRKIIGDLSDWEAVMQALDLSGGVRA